MRVHVRERPYDLYAVMASSLILLIILLAIPGATALRIVLGLPFILFFPGYALVSALYPERPLAQEEPEGPVDEVRPDPRVARAYKRQMRRERKKALDPEEGDGEAPAKRTKGLDILERIALSLGLSIAISPLIGLLLNYTYDWDPENLGIRLTTVFGGLFMFIIVTSAVAVKRRMSLPVQERFGIELDLSMPEDYSTADKALTVGIAIMMVLSISLLVYIIAFPREGERFTEFYVLGRGGMADDYPRYFVTGEPQKIFLGIGNHEQRGLDYTVVMSIAGEASNRTYPSFDNVSVSSSVNPSMSVHVGEGRTLDMSVNFSIPDPGSFKLRILLFLGGQEYRDLHLWVKAFPHGLLGNEVSGVRFFATGGAGDPATAGRVEDGRLAAGFGIVNGGKEPLTCNVTFQTGTQRTYSAATPGNGTWALDWSNGLFVRVMADPESTAYYELDIELKDKPANLTVVFRSGSALRTALTIPLSEASI
jgi:uncharacterized membrane protein